MKHNLTTLWMAVNAQNHLAIVKELDGLEKEIREMKQIAKESEYLMTLKVLNDILDEL